MNVVAREAVRGVEVISALKESGIGIVVALPDIVTSDHLLWPISQDPEFRLIRICKEDEGVSICAGLAFAGRRAVLLMQHTGLLDSLNAVRAIDRRADSGRHGNQACPARRPR
jgi:sulfopyruvate decarboxylase TPP-binding subunit